MIFYVHNVILSFCMKYNATFKIFVFSDDDAIDSMAGCNKLFFYLFITFDFDGYCNRVGDVKYLGFFIEFRDECL